MKTRADFPHANRQNYLEHVSFFFKSIPGSSFLRTAVVLCKASVCLIGSSVTAVGDTFLRKNGEGPVKRKDDDPLTTANTRGKYISTYTISKNETGES